MQARFASRKVFLVALVTALVCSAVVTTSTVLLRPVQETNRQNYLHLNILKTSGLFTPGIPVEQQFRQLDIRLVDLRTGLFHQIQNPETWDMYKAEKDPAQTIALSPEQDIAGIKRRTVYAPVYLTRDDNQRIDKIILPIHGYGLWSTLYGFIALRGDTVTVIGLRFYEHAETPGLGGEVDSKRWLQQWNGKRVFDQWWQPKIQLVKGGVNRNDPNAIHQVDALSGATLTNRGVENILKFWLGKDGFGPFLARVRNTDMRNTNIHNTGGSL